VSNFNGNGLVDDGPNSGRRGPGAGLRPGQLFVENLKAIQEFHPVLLFGTQGSGKTHVLLSLLAYAWVSRLNSDAPPNVIYFPRTMRLRAALRLPSDL